MLTDLSQAVIRLATRAALTELFRPGQSFAGFVGRKGAGLVLLARGARIPLPEPGLLRPGQAVQIEVREGAAGLELHVRAQAARAPGRLPEPSGGPLVDRPTKEAQAADGSARAPVRAPGPTARGASPQPAARPAAGPRSEPIIRAILPVLAGRGSLGADLHRVVRLLSTAAARRALPPGLAEEARAVLDALLVARPDRLAQQVRLATRTASRSLESRLAEAAASGDSEGLDEAARTDPRAVLSRLLREAGDLLRRGDGQDGMAQAVRGALGRLAAGQLANLRDHDQPYVFVEVPFHPDTPVRRCQLRIFPGGREGRRRSRSLTVVFDLATRHLGDLWISLLLDEDRCSCRISAADPTAEAALRDARVELADGLESAGYRGAAVEVRPWDGDRLREVGELMRGVRGLDVQA